MVTPPRSLLRGLRLGAQQRHQVAPARAPQPHVCGGPARTAQVERRVGLGVMSGGRQKVRPRRDTDATARSMRCSRQHSSAWRSRSAGSVRLTVMIFTYRSTAAASFPSRTSTWARSFQLPLIERGDHGALRCKPRVPARPSRVFRAVGAPPHCPQRWSVEAYVSFGARTKSSGRSRKALQHGEQQQNLLPGPHVARAKGDPQRQREADREVQRGPIMPMLTSDNR